MNSGIYEIKNKINGKMYIGQSRNINKRRSYHLWKLRSNNHFNPLLQNSFNKYGEHNFEFIILEECEPNLLNDKEIQYIAKFNAFGFGYNLSGGGDGGIGRKVSEKTRFKISNANIGRIQDEKSKKRKSMASKKLWSTSEYKNKMNLRNHGGGWNRGVNKTEEEKKHLSKKLKGRIITEEHKQKLHEIYKGENSITAKLNENDVIEIRLRFLNGENQCNIKNDYEVSTQTIYDIVRNRRWKHIPNTIEELKKLKEAK